jgi:hypothetical protein
LPPTMAYGATSPVTSARAEAIAPLPLRTPRHQRPLSIHPSWPSTMLPRGRQIAG